MILLRDRSSDSLWRRECIGDCTDITFPLLTYLSSFLYRFPNPVTLMVILRSVGFYIWFRWCQLTSWFPLWPKKNRFKGTPVWSASNILPIRCYEQRRQYREQRKVRCIASRSESSAQVGKDHIIQQKYNRIYSYECVSSKRIQQWFENRLIERR